MKISIYTQTNIYNINLHTGNANNEWKREGKKNMCIEALRKKTGGIKEEKAVTCILISS